jgi:pyruvate dehydrogenase E2 component (dihydrolipoamide acetyltransferase)
MADPAASNLKGEVTVTELTRETRAIVRRSSESRATVPHLELELEAVLDDRPAAVEALEQDMTTVVVAACARALRSQPETNAAYRDGHWERYGRINVGVVVAAERVYAIPTVIDADRWPLDGLRSELGRLRRRALDGELSPPELAGATFTVWPAGELGLSRAALPPVPPQAAVLVAGTLRGVPTVRRAGIVPGYRMTLVLSCDHRILYGAVAAAFLRRVETELQEATP